MQIIFYISIFLLGLCAGSFINVIVLRVPQKISFLGGRSRCPKCQKQLCWYELIPLLSFLLLRGKCGKCRQKISWQYPLVELAAGLLFVLVSFYFAKFFSISWLFPPLVKGRLGWLFPPLAKGKLDWLFPPLAKGKLDWLFPPLAKGRLGGVFYIFNYLILLYIASIFLLIFIYDLKYYIILNRVVYPSSAIILLALLLNSYYFKNNFIFPSLYSGLAGAAIGGGFFFSLIFISQGRWMGMGDGKLAILIGLMLGYERLLCALMLAFVVGAIWGIILILMGRKKMKSELPFGTFLSLAALASLLYGDKLISWYLSFLSF